MPDSRDLFLQGIAAEMPAKGEPLSAVKKVELVNLFRSLLDLLYPDLCETRAG